MKIGEQRKALKNLPQPSINTKNFSKVSEYRPVYEQDSRNESNQENDRNKGNSLRQMTSMYQSSELPCNSNDYRFLECSIFSRG